MLKRFRNVRLQYKTDNTLRTSSLRALKQILSDDEYKLLLQLNNSSKLCFYLGTSNLDPTKQLAAVMCFRPHRIDKIDKDSIYTIYFDPTVTDYSKMLNTANCGNCLLSDLQLRGCYTNFLLRRNIRFAIKQLDNGTMPMIDFNNPSHVALVELFTGRMKNIRFGESGDPISVPASIHNRVDSVFARFKNRVGYTHQWREHDYRNYATVIASVNSASEIIELENIYGGVKYARVIKAGAPLLSNERLCPQMRGIVQSCAECGLCQRNKAPKVSIIFIAHGTTGIHRALETIEKQAPMKFMRSTQVQQKCGECVGCPMMAGL